MPEKHLSREILEGVLRGEVEAKEVVREMLRHLLALCPECRRVWRAMALPRRHGAVASLLDAKAYAPAFQRALMAARRQEVDLEQEREEARRLVAALVQEPQARQRALLERDRRFHTWGVCDLLINESYRAAFDDPEVAERLGALAVFLAERLDPRAYGASFLADVQAMAWTYLANARRVASDLKGADSAMERAEDLLAAGVGDPLARAQLLNLKASLRRAQRRFEESQQLLEEVIRIYRRLGDHHMEGRTLVKQALGYMEAGMAAGAVPILRRALELIDAERDRRLELCAHHNLASALVDLGRHREADELLAEIRPLYEAFPDFSTRLRQRWLEGRLAWGLDRTGEAEAAFQEARQGFIEHAVGYNAALVSLDLAGLYLARGETDRVRELAEEMLPIFRSRDVHREAMAALIIFQQAARAERATVQMVEKIASYLRRARLDPSLRYEEPS